MWPRVLVLLVALLGPSPPGAQFPDADTLWPSNGRRWLSPSPGTSGEEGGTSQGAAGVHSALAPPVPSLPVWLAPHPLCPEQGPHGSLALLASTVGGGGAGRSWLTSGNGQICELAPPCSHGLIICVCVYVGVFKEERVGGRGSKRYCETTQTGERPTEFSVMHARGPALSALCILLFLNKLLFLYIWHLLASEPEGRGGDKAESQRLGCYTFTLLPPVQLGLSW